MRAENAIRARPPLVSGPWRSWNDLGLCRSASSVVTVPGNAPFLQLELIKVVASARLAATQEWFDASLKEFEEAVDQISTAVSEQLKQARDRNDPKADRVVELDKLRKTGDWAGQAIQHLL